MSRAILVNLYLVSAVVFLIAVSWLVDSVLLAAPAFVQPDLAYDDSQSNLYWKNIERLAVSGFFDGTECGPRLFCPDSPVTRKTAAIWLIRSLGENNLAPIEESRFSDVDPSADWARYVERLAELGITTGCQGGQNFCPDKQLSRTQLAAFLTRTYNLEEPVEPTVFSDVDPAAWSVGYIEAATGAGLVPICKQGWSDLYCPQELATRADLATAIVRLGDQTAATVAVLAPREPRKIHVGRDELGRLWLKWRQPWRAGDTPISKYLIQWRASGEGFDASRQAEVSDVMKLSHTIDGVSADSTYTVRIAAFNQAGRGLFSEEVEEKFRDRALLEVAGGNLAQLSPVERSDLGILLRDDFWRYVEDDMLPRYEGDHAWLRSAWNHVKQEVVLFNVCLGPYCDMSHAASVHFDCLDLRNSGDQLESCDLSGLVLRRPFLSDDSIIAHELGHVLTLANGAGENQPQLAFAFLYFAELAGDDCSAKELFADTLEALVIGQGDTSYYWPRCRQTPAAPSRAAKQVVKEALAGQTPSWFEDHYQLGDGSWDYESIWADIKSLEEGVREATIYNLREQFGGYCSSSPEVLMARRNPWRTGDCSS